MLPCWAYFCFLTMTVTFLPVFDQQNNKPHKTRTTRELKDCGDLSCGACAHQPDFLIRALVISQIKYLMVAIQGIHGGRDVLQPF